MAEQRDNALLLRSIPYSDSSLILHCLTANHGRISFMAKGARRAKSPFRASLMPLHKLHIRWKEPRTGNMGILLEAQRLQPLLPETHMLAGQELMLKASILFPDGVNHGYNELKDALALLSTRPEETGLCAATWYILSTSGWIGDLQSCWHCSESVDNSLHMYWKQAHLLCHSCANSQGILFSSGYRKTIAAFMENPKFKLTTEHISLWSGMIRDTLKSHQFNKS